MGNELGPEAGQQQPYVDPAWQAWYAQQAQQHAQATHKRGRANAMLFLAALALIPAVLGLSHGSLAGVIWLVVFGGLFIAGLVTRP